MNQRFTNFIQSIRSVKLDDAAFARIRANLASYADLHAVASGVSAHAVRSPFMAFFSSTTFRYTGGIAVLLMLIGGGTISGAERAVPGDALYGIKVNVTEKVAASLADSPVEKAEYATKLATRRADEALVLLAEGKLDDTTATYLDTELGKNVEAATVAAAVIESEGDVAASLAVRTELESELAERVAVLDAEAPVAMEAAADAVMFMAKSASAEPEEPGARFAHGLRAHIARVTEARAHTAAILLPGLADADPAVLAPADEPIVAATGDAGADAGASATLMIAVDESATSTLVEPMRAKLAPPPNNAWPEAEPFWLPKE